MYPEKVLKVLQRARSLIQAGNPALALHDLEKAVQKFPSGFEAWFLLGHAKGCLTITLMPRSVSIRLLLFNRKIPMFGLILA